MRRGIEVSVFQPVWLLMALLLAGCNTTRTEMSPIQPPLKVEPAMKDARSLNKQAIFNAYFKAWDAPTNVPRQSKPVFAEITVAKDGRVLSSRITQLSGNATIDRSVQKALDQVHRVDGFTVSPTNQIGQFTFSFGFSVENRNGSLDWPPKSSDGKAGK